MSDQLPTFSVYRKYSQKLAPVFSQAKAQAYTMAILSFFTIAFFGIFAIRPTISTILVLQKQIEDRTEVSEKLEQKISALIKAQETYNQIETDVPTIYALLPDKPEVTTLLVKFEDVAVTTGTTITDITFDPLVIYGNTPQEIVSEQNETPNVLAETSEDATTPFSFSISYTGTYQQLSDVLSRIAQLDRIVTISKAEIKLSGTANNDTGILTVSLGSQAYYYPLNQ
ncbi:hypothetical protein C4579_04740 [Candidatus Microgenomates bacterium]|nr:MAG: hypothetical protein C4579_04740 [Candidatus Microgenomates bacterium]